MVAWYWVLIAGSLGAILGFFLFCVFAVGGEKSGEYQSTEESLSSDNPSKAGGNNWY